MELKWEQLNPEEFSSKDLLVFRNRVLGIDAEPSSVEIKALDGQIAESSKNVSNYDLLALKDGKIVAWANGLFSEVRLADMIRMFFFDADDLGEQGVDNLLYQIEFALPYPYRRIEIYGLGPHRERDVELVMRSGYRQAYDISHYQWIKGAPSGPESRLNLTYENKVNPKVGFDIYTSAFTQTWDRDEVSYQEFESSIVSFDLRLSFTAFLEENPVGIMIVQKGLDEGDTYLQIIAISERDRGSGIGDAMMMNLMNLMMSHNIRSLSLSTYADNESMKKLMKRWHFVEQFRETVLFKEDFKKVDSQ